jgi:hypothetical protein
MHMHNNDPTNFWALSSKVLSDLLGVLGFVEVTEVWRVRPPMLERPMARVVIVARKPG